MTNSPCKYTIIFTTIHCRVRAQHRREASSWRSWALACVCRRCRAGWGGLGRDTDCSRGRRRCSLARTARSPAWHRTPGWNPSRKGTSPGCRTCTHHNDIRSNVLLLLSILKWCLVFPTHVKKLDIFMC